MERETKESREALTRQLEASLERMRREVPALRAQTERGIENLRRIAAGKRPLR